MNIINWENTFTESSKFQKRNPTKWAFVKNFLNEKFYEELYDTFPKFDETWSEEDSYDKIYYRKFREKDEESNIITKNDSRFSESWNKLMNHLWSEDFINNLPDKLESNVGNVGSKISGGQRQRIGIARSLYTNPEILILDEATNSLDIENENKIIHEIFENKSDKTVIIISHRHHNLHKFDKIYKIENGRVRLNEKT